LKLTMRMEITLGEESSVSWCLGAIFR